MSHISNKRQQNNLFIFGLFIGFLIGIASVIIYLSIIEAEINTNSYNSKDNFSNKINNLTFHYNLLGLQILKKYKINKKTDTIMWVASKPIVFYNEKDTKNYINTNLIICNKDSIPFYQNLYGSRLLPDNFLGLDNNKHGSININK